MRSELKQIFLSALMVIGATMATTGAIVLGCLVAAAFNADGLPASSVLQAGPTVVVVAAFCGLFFAVVTLPVAAFTMPLGLGLIRVLKLPRPLFDIFGGAGAGFLCSQVAVSLLDSIARSKGGDWGGDELRLLMEVCAIAGGGALAYLRHAVLVKPRAEPLEPQPA